MLFLFFQLVVQVVVFDVTSDFMETFLSTYWMLFSEGAATKGNVFSNVLNE